MRLEPPGRSLTQAGNLTVARWGKPEKRSPPDLYVACGISGAIQHLAGMQSSRGDCGHQQGSRKLPFLRNALTGWWEMFLKSFPELIRALKEGS